MSLLMIIVLIGFGFAIVAFGLYEIVTLVKECNPLHHEDPAVMIWLLMSIAVIIGGMVVVAIGGHQLLQRLQ